MPKEYTLIGGNGTVVSPLEVNESGTYEAGDSRAFNPVKVNVPSGSSTLAGLTDVDISTPTNGQTLVYNATSGKWENGAGGGGFTIVNGTLDPDTDDIIIPDMTIGDFLELTQPVLVHVTDVGFDAYSLTMVIMRTENNQATISLNTLSGSMQCSGSMDTPLVFTMPY